MECEIKLQVKKYLRRFEEILKEMECKMLNARVCDNITLYFIKCMIPHHQAAIYMCENLLQYTDYEPLQNIADNIIKTQTRGIEQMREIAMTTEGFSNTPDEVVCYQIKYLGIVQNMIYRMRNSLRGNNINLNFVSEMIPHHEGAIAMCNNLLQYHIDPRLREVAQNIIEEQSRGVMELKQVQRELSK